MIFEPNTLKEITSKTVFLQEKNSINILETITLPLF